ncbi:MAG: hypothetical protein F9Y92_05270, partial [Thermoplasmatales archaeon]|nr:hypothetical protein [Thermoplasmatales archaeon]
MSGSFKFEKSLVILVIAIFILSSFTFLAKGSDLVEIKNGFDSRLLSGKVIGVPDLNIRIDVSIALKLRNEKNLDNYLMEVENPDSPMFHHFISKDEFKNLYSPTDDEFNSVFKYFKDQWNDVTPGPYNLAIFINDVP